MNLPQAQKLDTSWIQTLVVRPRLPAVLCNYLLHIHLGGWRWQGLADLKVLLDLRPHLGTLWAGRPGIRTPSYTLRVWDPSPRAWDPGICEAALREWPATPRLPAPGAPHLPREPPGQGLKRPGAPSSQPLRPCCQAPTSNPLRPFLFPASYHSFRNPLSPSKLDLNLIFSKRALPIPASGIHLSRHCVPLPVMALAVGLR